MANLKRAYSGQAPAFDYETGVIIETKLNNAAKALSENWQELSETKRSLECMKWVQAYGFFRNHEDMVAENAVFNIVDHAEKYDPKFVRIAQMQLNNLDKKKYAFQTSRGYDHAKQNGGFFMTNAGKKRAEPK